MQYHAQCFADVASVERVTVVGYNGERCISSLEPAAEMNKKQQQKKNSSKIVLHRFTQFEAPAFLIKSTFLRQILKGLVMCLHLLYKFLTLPKYDVVIIQNPPCLPVLLAAIFVYIVSGFRFQIWLDWHNLGFTMFKRGSLASKISKVLERILSRFAHRHFCVSKAMQEWLEMEFDLKEVLVLYDRPTRRFTRGSDDYDYNDDDDDDRNLTGNGNNVTPRRHYRRSQRAFSSSSSPSSFSPSTVAQNIISIQQRHELFMRLNLVDASVFKHDPEKNDPNDNVGTTTVQTYIDADSTCQMRNDACRILLSSTSWTEDEDFSLLLDALIKLNKKLMTNSKKSDWGAFESNRILCIITGKGPLKETFLDKYRKVESSMTKVSIITPWLEPEDYPLLVKCADAGVCLHTSTSGLDLPMKVLDMFGAGLAVVALEYPAIVELIKNNENGLLFDETLSVNDNKGRNSNNDMQQTFENKLTHKDDLKMKNYGSKETPTSRSLYDCLDKLFCIPTSKLKINRLRMSVVNNNLSALGWEALWQQTMDDNQLLGNEIESGNSNGKEKIVSIQRTRETKKR